MSIVQREVRVDVDVNRAFAVFTDRIGEWWPLATHSISSERHGAPAAAAAFIDGVLCETAPDGERHEWGEVRAWEPPNRLVFSWHLGRGRELATEVEVTFAPVPGGTLVTLEHRGWEIWGDREDEVRASYETGWPKLLAAYAEAT